MKTVTAGDARIPALGFGTWQLRGAEATDMVTRALSEGWRHVDTARMYGNEAEVGAGLRAAGVPREQVFLTTKIWPDDHAPDRLRAAAEESIRMLGVGAPDMVLLHWPSRSVPLEETIPALCALARDGLAGHVGVSNFTRAQLAQAVALADMPLAVNQVDITPGSTRPRCWRRWRGRAWR